MLIRRFLELLTPEPCLGCGRGDVVLCATCAANFGSRKGNSELSLAELNLEGLAVGAYYDGAVKELILRLKFHRLRSAVDGAAELVLRALPEEWPLDLVTAVPVSPGRYRERGYNQSELIARRVASRRGLPFHALLGRHTSTHQLGVDRRTRLEQVKEAFYPLKNLSGERVLVVDDVVTTGATVAECAAALRAAGGGAVWAAAVARH